MIHPTDRQGVPEDQLLVDFPGLIAANLHDAWAYARDHENEIAEEIRQAVLDEPPGGRWQVRVTRPDRGGISRPKNP